MASYQDLLGRKGNKGDITNVPVELRSIPQMGESMEMEVRAADVLVTLISAADSLIKSGCSIITLPCNTSDVFKDELSLYCAQKGAIFVSISDSVLDHLRANEIQEFFIIGGQAVSALDRWSSYANLDEKFSARGMPDNLSSLVHEIGFDIKKGADANRVVQRMQAVWAHVQAKGQGKAAAVIALTELSEVFAGPHARALEKLPIRVIDALAVYAERVADVAFNQPRLDRVPDNILPLREGLLHDAIRRSFVRRAAVPGAA